MAGTGLVGVAKDNLPRTGTVPALAAGFIEIELDTEPGKFEILDYVGVADCGTVLHPGLPTRSRAAPSWASASRRPSGTSTTRRTACPATSAAAVEARVVPRRAGHDADGLGRHRRPAEPGRREGHRRAGAGLRGGALLCAISDALGGHYFNRTPVMADMIVNAAAKREQSHKPLQVNTA